jgi:endonuclease/exonuclease/phosphatase family metal-dependent hydrolase
VPNPVRALRFRLVLAVAVAALTACAARLEAPPAAAPPALRIATWNVQNLFDEVRDGGAPDETVPSAAVVARKLERLGAVLRDIDADIAILQEVENREVLARLAQGPLAGLQYRAFLVDGTDPRGIDVGVLSRVPLERYLVHRGPPGTSPLFTRDPVEAHFRVAGREVVVVAAHLVSKRDPAKDDRRARQAARLREIADRAARASPDALVVVAGDLNDGPSSAPLAPLLRDGEWVDAAARLPSDRSWTYLWRGARERLDYVLVARRDAARIARVEVWERVARSASDHRPIVLDVALR